MKTDEKSAAVIEDTRESVSFGTRDKDFSKEPLCLSGRGVTRVFHTGKVTTVAVDHVDFDFHEGELAHVDAERAAPEADHAHAQLLERLVGVAHHRSGRAARAAPLCLAARAADHCRCRTHPKGSLQEVASVRIHLL